MKKVREAIKVWYERNEANISAVAGIIALVVKKQYINMCCFFFCAYLKI